PPDRLAGARGVLVVELGDALDAALLQGDGHVPGHREGPFRRWAGGTDENGTVRDSSLCGRWGDGTAETRHPRIVDNLTIAEPGAATATPAPIPAAHRRAADTPVHDRLPIVDNPPGGSLAFQPPGGAPPRPAPPIRSRLRDHRNPAPAQRSPLGAAPRRAARRRTAA